MKPDQEQLDTLLRWMLEAGLQKLHYAQGGSSVRIELAPPAAGGPAAVTHVVKSRGMGRFLAAHPLAAHPFAAPGDSVRAGQILGLLAAGQTFTAITAPLAGILKERLVTDGTLIGHGTPVLVIEAPVLAIEEGQT